MMERYCQNLNQINPAMVEDIPSEELEQKFTEYYIVMEDRE